MKTKLEREEISFNKSKSFKNNLYELVYDIMYSEGNFYDNFLKINVIFVFDLYSLVKYIVNLKIDADKKIKKINKIFSIISYINNNILRFYENIIINKNENNGNNIVNTINNIVKDIGKIMFENEKRDFIYKDYIEDMLNNINIYDIKSIKKLYNEMFKVIKLLILKNIF